jgi:hypothetical protein
VLLIGDSIASTGLGYAGFKDSEGALHERATILNPTTNLPETSPDTNAETSQNTLDHLAKWIGSSDPDVIHINTGLWEVKGVDEKDVPAIVARYKQNVARIFDQLQAMRPRATIVWATTTPVSDPNTKRRNSDIDAINAAAAEVTTARHVVVDDLHAFTIDNHLTHLAEGDGGTHFDEPSRRAQMRHVSEVILRVLPGAD